MKAKIRTLEKSDIDGVFAGWDAAFPLDEIPLKRFEHRILNDRYTNFKKRNNHPFFYFSQGVMIVMFPTVE